MQYNLTHLRERKKSMKKNYSRLVKGILFGVVTLSLLGMLLIPSFQPQTRANDENGRVEYLARISKGVAGVEFASSAAAVPSAIANMDSYITERSGLRFSPLVSDKLSSLEQATLSSQKELITFDKLVSTITSLGMERLSELNDVELDQAVSSTHFNSPDLPEAIKTKPMFSLRPGYYILLDKTEVIDKLKSLQSPRMQLMAKNYIGNFISQELTNTLVNLAAASPEKFGQNWDFINNRSGKPLTPAQAYLLSYSLVSGDSLADDKAQLQKTMDVIYQHQVKTLGRYPNPNNYLPYGSNGYLHSSSVNIFFNETVQLELLERLTK